MVDVKFLSRELREILMSNKDIIREYFLSTIERFVNEIFGGDWYIKHCLSDSVAEVDGDYRIFYSIDIGRSILPNFFKVSRILANRFDVKPVEVIRILNKNEDEVDEIVTNEIEEIRSDIEQLTLIPVKFSKNYDHILISDEDIDVNLKKEIFNYIDKLVSIFINYVSSNKEEIVDYVENYVSEYEVENKEDLLYVILDYYFYPNEEFDNSIVYEIIEDDICEYVYSEKIEMVNSIVKEVASDVDSEYWADVFENYIKDRLE